ncbi:MAG: VCBS repeat-containing protein, partial [Thermoplasmata archaeon]|nr:VCBS repeat-containing protein [Thermoplasmata archaeon]
IFDPEKNRYLSWYHTVSVWRNTGSNNFTRYVNDLKTQKGVLSIDIGDINQDGRPDISMTNWGYNEVSYILSDGNGDFLRGSVSELDSESLKAYDPISQALTDLDGDGRLDMVVLSKSADSIMVFPGKADGYFGDYTMYYTGMSPSSFELFDFDGDGDLDVLTSDRRSKTQVAGSNGTVSVLINLNRGVFSTYRQFRTGNSPRGVFAHDLNNDGSPEIATANYFGSTVSILRNDGVGGFSPNKEYPIGLEPYAVILADFNNDGYIDGASADEANFRIVILESDKNGGFTTERHWFDIGGYPFSLRAKDINHDGFIDLYTSNYFQNTTTIMFNDGTSILDNTTFNDYFTVDLGDHMPYDALMEDMNGDGHYDLITVNRGDDLDPTDTISILLNDGNFNFDNIVDYKVGKEPTSAAIFDVDGDGSLDLVSSNSKDDTVTILINDGDGYLTKLEDVTVGFKPLFVSYIDHDQDGWNDIVVTNSLSNDISFLRNIEGTGFQHVRDYNIGSGPYMIDSADFDGDGREDIVVTSVNTGYAVVFDCYYYPTGFSLDLGNDGTYEFLEDGFMDYQVQIDLADEINDYMAGHSNDGDTVRIPLSALSRETGMVRLYNLDIIYQL